MNESYCDEISENLTTFVTVGNARWERRCKQKITFLAVTWFTICEGPQNWVSKEQKNKFEIDAVLWVTYIHHYFYKAWNYWRYKILNQDKTGSTKIWESMENKTQNNDHNIYERKHSGNFL